MPVIGSSIRTYNSAILLHGIARGMFRLFDIDINWKCPCWIYPCLTVNLELGPIGSSAHFDERQHAESTAKGKHRSSCLCFPFFVLVYAWIFLCVCKFAEVSIILFRDLVTFIILIA